MQKLIKRTLPLMDKSLKITFSAQTLDDMNLPRFNEGKRLSCPSNTKIADVINFLSNKVHFEKFVVCNPGQFDPLKHVEILMPVRVHPESSPDTVDYYITLD